MPSYIQNNSEKDIIFSILEREYSHSFFKKINKFKTHIEKIYIFLIINSTFLKKNIRDLYTLKQYLMLLKC